MIPPVHAHILSTYLTGCPACEAQMHYTEYLADEMVEEALSQNAEIEHVFAPDETLAPCGVWARLRFTLQGFRRGVCRDRELCQ